jgi:hypothetical protein
MRTSLVIAATALLLAFYIASQYGSEDVDACVDGWTATDFSNYLKQDAKITALPAAIEAFGLSPSTLNAITDDQLNWSSLGLKPAEIAVAKKSLQKLLRRLDGKSCGKVAAPQPAGSVRRKPIADMSSADVAAFLQEHELQSHFSQEMDGAALLEFVKWHDDMPAPVRAEEDKKQPESAGHWERLARALKQLSNEPAVTFWEWHSNNVRLSEMWCVLATECLHQSPWHRGLLVDSRNFKGSFRCLLIRGLF